MVNKTKKKGDLDFEEKASIPVKKRTTPTNTSLLPPCKVCLEPAAGFHYGVNTCEACKGFFRRTLVRKGDYECINGDEKCTIVQVGKSSKKRVCPRCRHLKCLAVGMSVGAIKTGRYTHAKRTQDILEYRQMLCMLSTSSCQTIPDTTGIATGLSTSFTSIHCGAASSAGWPAAANIPGNVHCRGWSAPYNHFIPSMPQAFSAAPSSITPHDAIIPRHVGMSVNSEAFSPVNVQVLPTTPMQHMLATSPVAPGFLSATSYQSDGRHCRESARHVFHPIKCDDFLYRQEPCTGVVCQSPFNHDTRFGSVSQQVVGPGGAPCRSLSYDGAGSVEVCFHTAPSHPHVLTPSSEFVVEQKQPEHLMPPPSWTSFTSRDMTDEECRLLSAELLRSHSVLFVLCRYSFSPKELLRRQTMCYENCKARVETFGLTGELSEEEYQEIYQTTGIDVDDRQAFISSLSKMLDENIRQNIQFVKTIPGFSSLTMRDQVRLIRDHRCEMGMVFQADGYNHDIKVQTMPSGRSFCEHDMMKFGGIERCITRFECMHALQKLSLTPEEKVLFQCMMLFTVGKEDVDEPDKVSDLQWTMAQCLRWLLRSGRPDPDLHFASIIGVFLSMKTYACSYYEWMNNRPFAHYSQFEKNELLAEWFSAS